MTPAWRLALLPVVVEAEPTAPAGTSARTAGSRSYLRRHHRGMVGSIEVGGS